MSEVNEIQAMLLEEGSIQSLGKDELDRVQKGLAIYRAGHPLVAEESITFLGEYGLETGMLLASALGAIVVSSLRVGTALLVSESNFSATYTQAASMAPFLSAILAASPALIMAGGLLCFEAFLFGAGYRRGRHTQTIKVPIAGIVIAFAVTISAGLLSSLSLDTSSPLQVLQPFALTATILSTAIGAPAIAFFGAENIGVMHTSYLEKVRNREKDIIAAKKRSNQDFWVWYRRNALKIFGVDRSNHSEAPQARDSSARVDIQPQVESWLAENGLTAHQIGLGSDHVKSPKDISDDLGYPNSDRVRVVLARLRDMTPLDEGAAYG